LDMQKIVKSNWGLDVWIVGEKPVGGFAGVSCDILVDFGHQAAAIRV
jgi:hypothetical protein